MFVILLILFIVFIDGESFSKEYKQPFKNYFHYVVRNNATKKISCNTSFHPGYEADDNPKRALIRGRVHIVRLDMLATHTVYIQLSHKRVGTKN